MPKGFEEEIASRGEGFFRFVALLAPRALIDWPTLAPSLNRDQLSWWRVFLIGSPRQWQLRLGRRAYANLVADALSSLSSTTVRAGKCYLGIDVWTSQTRTINDRHIFAFPRKYARKTSGKVGTSAIKVIRRLTDGVAPVFEHCLTQQLRLSRRSCAPSSPRNLPRTSTNFRDGRRDTERKSKNSVSPSINYRLNHGECSISVRSSKFPYRKVSPRWLTLRGERQHGYRTRRQSTRTAHHRCPL